MAFRLGGTQPRGSKPEVFVVLPSSAAGEPTTIRALRADGRVDEAPTLSAAAEEIRVTYTVLDDGWTVGGGSRPTWRARRKGPWTVIELTTDTGKGRPRVVLLRFRHQDRSLGPTGLASLWTTGAAHLGVPLDLETCLRALGAIGDGQSGRNTTNPHTMQRAVEAAPMQAKGGQTGER